MYKYNSCLVAILAAMCLGWWPTGAACQSPTNNDRKAETILFVSNRDSQKQRLAIYEMRADGSKPKRISAANAFYEFDPVFSPDRKKIAFAAPNYLDDYTMSIWVMNADGSDAKKLTNKKEMACAPAWSPDGKQIAFCDMKIWTGKHEVFVMNADGSKRRKLGSGFFPF
jgi:TolB protein